MTARGIGEVAAPRQNGGGCGRSHGHARCRMRVAANQGRIPVSREPAGCSVGPPALSPW
jgi:hypothetical protein